MTWDIGIRNDQRDDDSRICVAMCSTEEQHCIAWVAVATAAELCPENHCTGPRIRYELWNGDAGILVLMKRELTIGKVKSSRLL